MADSWWMSRLGEAFFWGENNHQKNKGGQPCSSWKTYGWIGFLWWSTWMFSKHPSYRQRSMDTVASSPLYTHFVLIVFQRTALQPRYLGFRVVCFLLDVGRKQSILTVKQSNFLWVVSQLAIFDDCKISPYHMPMMIDISTRCSIVFH